MRCKHVLTAVLCIVYRQQYLHSVTRRVHSIVMVAISYSKSTRRSVDTEATPAAPLRAPLKASVSRLKIELASPGTYSREREAHLHPRPRHHVETSSEQSSPATKGFLVCLFFYLMWFVPGLINFVQQKDLTLSVSQPLLGRLVAWY